MPLSLSGAWAGSARRCAEPGIGAPVVAVGQEGRPREFSGRPREGDSLVALVGGLERSRWVQRRVRHRRVAERLRGVRVVVEVELARRVDGSVAIGQVQGQGLAFLDIPQRLSEGGLHAEASASPFVHLLLYISPPKTWLSLLFLPAATSRAIRWTPWRSAGAYLSCGIRRFTASVIRPISSA